MYKILIDDNFHFMDESERTDHGDFATAEEAIAECKAIIDDNLAGFMPRKTAQELFEIYAHLATTPLSSRPSTSQRGIMHESDAASSRNSISRSETKRSPPKTEKIAAKRRINS